MKENPSFQQDQQEIASLRPESISTQNIEAPSVTRDERGKIRWNLPENTPEQNEQLGIANVQGLFLEKYPDFRERFPFDENGKILKENQDKARIYILEKIGSKRKISEIIGHATTSKITIPYFGGSYRTVLSKSFVSWGIEFDWEEKAPEGWITNTSLSEVIGLDRKTTSNLANRYRESNPTWYKEYLNSAGSSNEHYSPGLVKVVSDIVSNRKQSPDNWTNAKRLSRSLKMSYGKITEIANEFRGIHPEWFKMYLSPQGQLCEHYSPELVSLVVERQSKYQSAPEGWMTTWSLSSSLKRDWHTVNRLAKDLSRENPHWVMTYLDPSGRLAEYFSPEISKMINEEISKFQPSPEDWIHAKTLGSRMGKGSESIKRLINQLRDSYPDHIKVFRGTSGRITEYFSPELVTMIVGTVGDEQDHDVTISPDQANEELMRFLEVKDE